MYRTMSMLATAVMFCAIFSCQTTPPIRTVRSAETLIEQDAGYAASYEEWFDMRAYPREIMNWQVYPKAHRYKEDMDIAPPTITHWEYLGPTNLDTYIRWGAGLPPINGRVNAVAFDPADPGNTYYAASACGGVWKTIDGGEGWFPLSDDWSELYTGAIAISPAEPHRILVGTGDYPGSRGSGIGLLISDNGGFDWHVEGSFFKNKRISDIVIDPDDPNLITVATAPGASASYTRIYQSFNGGDDWGASLDVWAKWSDLAISAPALFDDGTVLRYYYAGGVPTDGSDGNELWRSADRGQTWEELELPPWAAPLITNRQIGIATSRSDYRTVYVVGTTVRQVWKSTDAGESWSNITGDLPQDSLWWGQDFYSFRLHSFLRETSGGPRDALLLATTDVFLYDGFAWKSIGGPTYSDEALIHVDIHGFATHPEDPTVHLVTNDGGVYRYDYDPELSEGFFTNLNRNLGCMLVNKMSVHPWDINWMMAGTQDNGTPIAVGDLHNWFNIVAGDTGHTAINQDLPAAQYAARPFLGLDEETKDVFVDRTVDFWQHRDTLSTNIGEDQLRHGTPIFIDPNDTHLIYFATQYLYRYDELEQQWDKRLGGQRLSQAQGDHVKTFDIAPSDSNRIITGSRTGQVWITSDRGENWDRIDESDIAPLPDASVSAVSIDPTDRDRVLIAFAGTWDTPLWECKDVTADPIVWEQIKGTGSGRLPELPINAIARHPDAPKSHWFVGTDLGVFGTNNAGHKWYNMTNPLGLPNVPIMDLKAKPLTRYLYAATYGRGIWRLKIKKIPAIWIQPP